MGIFNSLFNSNKKRWEGIAANSSIPLYMKNVIKDFFIVDNIDVDKYIENDLANSIVDTGLDLWEFSNTFSMDKNVQKQKINCTKTFRAHFSNDRFNRGLDVPDWFYIAYPDVAYWMNKNTDSIEKELSGRESEFLTNGKLGSIFFRFIIEKYKKENNRLLECVK